MKIIICPDSFKGCLTASEVAETIEDCISSEISQYQKLNSKIDLQGEIKFANLDCKNLKILKIPLADGGEGTAQILKTKHFPIERNIQAHDPLGRLINTKYYGDSTGTKAFIESAEIIGLPLLSPKERNPLITTSYGLGEVINKAIQEGYTEISIALGGSATCDAGKGMIEALEGIDVSAINFKIICDVKNPLLGEEGTVRIFGPQKGAKTSDIPLLDKRIEDFVNYSQRKFGINKNNCSKEGSGAAGGLGFAFQSILRAETIFGIDYIMKETDFDKEIEDAALIITGEGKVDSQSLMGKVLAGVLKRANKRNIPVIVFGGIIEDKKNILDAGVKEIYEISDKNLTLEENMNKENTKKNIRVTIKRMIERLSL